MGRGKPFVETGSVELVLAGLAFELGSLGILEDGIADNACFDSFEPLLHASLPQQYRI